MSDLRTLETSAQRAGLVETADGCLKTLKASLDARVLSIFEDAEETLALKVIARSLLDQARDGQIREG
jgi:hypothetical protein